MEASGDDDDDDDDAAAAAEMPTEVATVLPPAPTTTLAFTAVSEDAVDAAFEVAAAERVVRVDISKRGNSCVNLTPGGDKTPFI